jgi:hypothetical protein
MLVVKGDCACRFDCRLDKKKVTVHAGLTVDLTKKR